MKLVLPDSRKPVKRYTGISIILNSKKFLYLFFVNACTDNAKAANYSCRAAADIGLTGNVVKVYPLAALALNDTLGAKDHTVIVRLGEGIENCLDALNSKFFGSLNANRGKYLVCVVMVMIMIVTTTTAMLVVIVVMFVVAMASTLVMLIVVVMLVVAMASALVVLVVIVMLVVTVASALVMLVVIVMLVVMMVLVLLLKSLYSILESILVLHGLKNILTVKAVPGCSYDNCALVMLTEKAYALADLLVSCALCMRKHDR